MFEIIKKLFKKNIDSEDAAYETEEKRVPLSRRQVNMRNEDERERFITECCEQMRDAEKEIERLTDEYAYVTGYLTDMEELEALPATEKKRLAQAAEKLVGSGQQKADFDRRPSAMADADYNRMERFKDSVEEAIDKLYDTEDYGYKIKRDLKRLNQEHHGFLFRKKGLLKSRANLRGLLIISLVAFVACMLLLLILNIWLGMNVQMGYLGAVVILIAAIYVIYMKYLDTTTELKRIERSINKLIQLQNKVKIRYVNNVNLMDYLCLKYQVNSSEELQELWDKYKEEKEAREKIRRLNAELDGVTKDFVKMLSGYRIRDPHIWIKQPEAFVIKGEMVEIRHNLIAQRQQLRKQMEYNQNLAGEAREELVALTQEFPKAKPQVMKIVEQFESKGHR